MTSNRCVNKKALQPNYRWFIKRLVVCSADSWELLNLEARLTVAGGQQKVSRPHNVAKYTNKKWFFAVSAGTCKAARITKIFPPAETKQRHDQTWHCGVHSVPLCSDSSFIMFYAAFTQGEETDGFKYDSPLAHIVKTPSFYWALVL